MAQRETNPDLGYSGEGQHGDYFSSPGWDYSLPPTQVMFDPTHSHGPAQGFEPLQSHFPQQVSTQPHINTHSAPQLHTALQMSTHHNRPHNSSPFVFSGRSTRFDTSDVFCTSDDRSALPMGMSLRQSIPEVNSQPVITIFEYMLTCGTDSGTDV